MTPYYIYKQKVLKKGKGKIEREEEKEKKDKTLIIKAIIKERYRVDKSIEL